MTTDQGLTIFIPVYNEADILEKNLMTLINFITKHTSIVEIIIVNNGSTDGTQEILSRLAETHSILSIASMGKKGVGAAFKKGISLATHNHIITVDMDLSISLAFIIEAHTLLNDYDIIVGSKITGFQQRSLLRKTASNMFIYLAGKLLGLSFHDYSIAAKGYQKALVQDFLANTNDQTFYVVELLYKAHHNKCAVREIPVHCHDRRQSKFNLFHEGIHKFGNLFMLWFKNTIKTD